ncbi:MAG: hypothetical protein AB1758_35645, partial [Candidatus Eremiobacterota bacterium]
MKIKILLAVLVLVSTLALVPEKGQVVGRVDRAAGASYWVAGVIRDSVVPGDRVAVVRNGSVLGEAQVVEVSGERAMLRQVGAFTPAPGDQVIWSGHGPVAAGPHPRLPSAPRAATAYQPPSQDLIDKYADKSRRPGKIQTFRPPTHNPPRASSPRFQGPSKPTTSFQGPAVP